LKSLGVYDKSTRQHTLRKSQESSICKELWKNLPNKNQKDEKFREAISVANDNGKFTTLTSYFETMLTCFTNTMEGMAKSVSLGIVNSHSRNQSPDNSDEEEMNSNKPSKRNGPKQNHNHKDRKRQKYRNSKRERDEQTANSDQESDKKHAKKKAKKYNKQKTSGHKSETKVKNTDLCNGCGKQGHSRKKCHYQTHPGYNNSDKPWETSTNGKKYASKGFETLKKLKNPEGKPIKWDLPKQNDEKDDKGLNPTINQTIIHSNLNFNLFKHLNVVHETNELVATIAGNATQHPLILNDLLTVRLTNLPPKRL